jgi:hypothetical protein
MTVWNMTISSCIGSYQLRLFVFQYTDFQRITGYDSLLRGLMKYPRFAKIVWILSFNALLLAACTSGQASVPTADPTTTFVPSDTPAPSPSPTAMSEPETTQTPAGGGGGSDHDICDPPFENADPLYFNLFWPVTNFCNVNVDPNEIYIGIVAKDAIPAIDYPVFISVDEADAWLQDGWPIMRFEHEGDVRGYPLAILIWHEIVNDVVGELPVALTFCPLCNATIAFDRTLPDGTLLDFGTTGNLRNSDLVMYDRQTESWWQQFTGEAIIGDLTGTNLEFLPSQIVSWSEFKSSNPEALVLSRDTGHTRQYGNNPYPGYDDINSSPWFPGLDNDERLPAMERVAAVNIEGSAKAYPFEALKSVQIVNDTVGSIPIVVFWKEGTQTTFGNFTTDVGSTGVFSREVEDQVLTFQVSEDTAIDGFQDLETGSIWNFVGEAVAGPLKGRSLSPVVSGEHFWFAWSVFLPESDIWGPEV